MSKRINKIKNLILIVAIVLCSATQSALFATHIVGSDMTFECLGNDFYQVNLTVRRDCVNGADDAQFDSPAYVGIFDFMGNPLDYLGRFGMIEMPIIQMDTIYPGRPECGYFGGEVCVTEARYEATVYLPFRDGGYVLGYQRCCRNVTLNNIVEPLNTGNTSFVCLTETTLTSCNSSPSFGDWPEIVICANEPLVFDHPAVDRDGDSLSYMLYTPHSGASEARPKPVPPPGPSYDTIEWAAGYGLDNLLGGEPLKVDPNTGQVTATPNTVGQFLVGVLVVEWRDGKVLSKTRRNFEYNVRACQDVADLGFDVPAATCDGLSVTFNNTSGDNFGFTWNFNSPSTDPAFQSTEESPTFIYEEEGFYTVTLSSTNPETDCEVSISKEIAVFNSELSSDFVASATACEDGKQTVRFSSTAVEPNQELSIDDYRWEVLAGDVIIPLFGNVVEVELDCIDSIKVSHSVTSTSGCTAQIMKMLALDDLVMNKLIDLVGDTVRICIGDSIALLNSAPEGVVYTWNPTTGLTFGDETLQNDPVASPSVTTLYTVTATDGFNTEEADVLVIVDMFPEFDFGVDSIELCRSGSQIPTINGSSDFGYSWSPSDQVNTSSPYSPNDPLFSPTGEGYFYVTVTNGACQIVDSVYVTPIGNDPLALDEALVASPELTTNDDGTISVIVPVNWEDLNAQFDIDSVYWTITTDGETVSGSGMDISATLQPTLKATLCIFIVDSDGCTTKITRVLFNNEDRLICFVADTVRVCLGSSIPLFNCEREGAIYTWTPLTGLSFDDTITYNNPIASPTETTLYTVTATDGVNTDEGSILVIVDTDPIFDFGIDSTELCRSGSQIPTINGSADYEYSWSPSDQVNTSDPYSPNDPQFSPTGEGYFYVTVTNGACELVDSVYVTPIGNDPVAVDEALVAMPEVVTNTDGTISISVPVNWEELEEQFDIDSVYWTITTDSEEISGSGMDITATVNPTTMATLCIFIVDSDGCTTKITRTILDNIPSITFISEDTISVCLGDTSFIVANPNSEWTYTWEPEEGLIFDDPNDQSNPRISPTESRFYYVTVTNGVDSVSDSIYIQSIDDVLDIEILEGEICSGVATVTAQNNTEGSVVEFEWSLDPNFSTIVATGATVEIPIESSPVTIYVRAQSEGFCGSNEDSITLEQDDYGIVADVTPINTCFSNEGAVSLNIPDSVDVDILWIASENITTEDLTSTDVDIVALDGQTEITVMYQVTDSEGCVATFDVIVPISDELIVSIDGDSESCTTTGTFFANANANLDSVNFEWSLDPEFGTILSTADTVTADLGETGIIYLRGTAGTCESNVAERMLDMKDLQLDADAPSRICLGDTADVDLIIPDGSNYTITWMDADEIISPLTGPEVIIVAIGGKDTIVLAYTADDGEGCVFMDEVRIPYSTVIDPNPIGNVECGTQNMNFMIDPIYQDGDIFWDFGVINGDTITSSLANPMVAFDTSGIYMASISSTMETCNFDPTDFFYEVPEILEITTEQDLEQLICGDTTLMLSASSNGSAITWTDVDNNLLAVGDSVEVNVSGISTVIATVSDAFGCTMELRFNISMYMFDITTDAPTEPVCMAGGELVINASDNTNSDISYMWTSATGIIGRADSSSVTVNPAMAEDLVLIATNNTLNCSEEIAVPISLGSLSPEINSSNGTNIPSGEGTTLTVTPTGDNYTYVWEDGTTDPTREITQEAGTTETYTVTVTDNDTGCMGEASITITVDPALCADDESVFLPTAFSPNSDGENDVLLVRANGLQSVDLQVVDRWGKEVYRGRSENEGWNGRHKNTGKELSPDVFAFCLRAVCEDGTVILRRGHVNLIR